MLHYLKKVSPASIPPNKQAPTNHKNDICFCKTIRPILYACRFLGLCPILMSHQDGKCVFRKSWPLYIHSVIVSCYFTYEVVTYLDIDKLTHHKSLLPLLDDITNIIYGCYAVLATMVVLLRIPKHVDTLNQLAVVFRDGVFCHSARKVVLLVQYGIISLVLIAVLMQGGALLWLHSSASYETNFTIGGMLLRLTQNVTFLFYAQFCTYISVIVGTLACFEKLTLSSLGYIPVHPTEGVDESNNTRSFMGIIPIKLCKGEHPRPVKFSFLNAGGVLEHLRIAHEEISLCIYSYNESMNPFFLLHIIVELVLLIVHWYAVIVFVVYSFNSTEADAIHLLNCLFVLLHTWGLFAFLKNAQHMKNMIEGLISFLLDYSTRISNEEEHQQTRFFIEKLKNHRPFSASGVFNIDLGIAGPISANILTYVLVALQFDILDE
ncbi:uncharacterized protein [Leptinotarsa decemlineata]|uniref:uncharacterized protein n=1 Tax=Leptinotarsa decemlineata TaxID=7539 RepID=UPI003D308C46